MENYSEMFSAFSRIMAVCLGAPLCVLLVIGFGLAFIQAVTQIQDQILTFVPKTFLLCALIIFGGPIAMEMVMDFLTVILMGIRHIK